MRPGNMTGVIPFNPDRKVDAGAQDEDLHTGVEPWGQRGRQAGRRQAWPSRDTIRVSHLKAYCPMGLPSFNLQPTVKTLASLPLPLEI